MFRVKLDHWVVVYRSIIFIVSVFAFFNIYGCGKKKVISMEEGNIPVNNIEIYFKVLGKGEPIVVLHGGPGMDHTYLLPQLQELAKTQKLIFYDQRASGRSTGDVDSLTMTVDQFVEDLEGIRQYFKLDKMNLLGHSWGGLLAMNYAIKYPENLRSLILISSPGASYESIVALAENRQKRMTPEDRDAMGRVMSSEGFKLNTSQAMQDFARNIFRNDFHNRGYLDSLTLDFNDRTAGNMLPIYTAFSNYMVSYDIREKLSVIDCPTLIIHGDYDPIPPKFTRSIQERIQGSEFRLLNNCGHFPFIESPTVLFESIKDFIEKTG